MKFTEVGLFKRPGSQGNFSNRNAGYLKDGYVQLLLMALISVGHVLCSALMQSISRNEPGFIIIRGPTDYIDSSVSLLLFLFRSFDLLSILILLLMCCTRTTPIRLTTILQWLLRVINNFILHSLPIKCKSFELSYLLLMLTQRGVVITPYFARQCSSPIEESIDAV